jgi:UDP-N-acetylglucosamine--N-acetylmuramyl-(pentapeptide) pyrophosphoryl-undecaprenol N-acetylglucosamine transferase
MLLADRGASREALGLASGDTLLLVFGGSQGARHLNQALVGLAPGLMGIGGVKVLHATGPKEHKRFAEALRDAGVRLTQHPPAPLGLAGAGYVLCPYLDRMAEAVAASDLVLCRAGATTLAELSAVGAAAVLVPFPFATDNHQETNAKALVESGAAVLAHDADIEGEAFRSLLFGLLADRERQGRMREASKSLGRTDAASRIADLVEQAARGAIES